MGMRIAIGSWYRVFSERDDFKMVSTTRTNLGLWYLLESKDGKQISLHSKYFRYRVECLETSRKEKRRQRRKYFKFL